ncbi:MAG: hypothetical protein KatS3mg105_2395 [Gemmatales bacterium]|nr:MAG: hypothetical protein KatS3mg105_2395 [Gemmatales bacterium]
MSRAYRIKVRETLRRVFRAKDGVSTQLELLEILPPEQMAELLAEELGRRGYERDGDSASKTLEGGIKVIVNIQTGTVQVQVEECTEKELEAEQEGVVFDEQPTQRERQLREAARQKLDKQAEQQAAQLQEEVTKRLENVLGDLRKELDQAVNRVTAEALKKKAAQLGQIKELSEDQEQGTLTIVVEV